MSNLNKNTVTEPKAKAVKTKVKKEVKVAGKRGRPVDTTSVRQKRLARFAEITANGGVVKRGRPATGKAVKVSTKKAKKEDVVETPVDQVNVPVVEKKKYVRPSRAKKTVVEQPVSEA